MSAKQSYVDLFFDKYRYLATEYAKRVHGYEKQGLEFEDIVQEMNIKIFMSIKGFARRWKEYKETGKMKPAPIEFWIRRSLVNKVGDFIKRLNYDNIHNQNKLSIGSDGVDVGVLIDSDIVFDMEGLKCSINGYDMLKYVQQNDDDKKRCFMLYLQGFKIGELQDMFKDYPFDVSNVVNTAKNSIMKQESQIKASVMQRYEVHQQLEEA